MTVSERMELIDGYLFGYADGILKNKFEPLTKNESARVGYLCGYGDAVEGSRSIYTEEQASITRSVLSGEVYFLDKSKLENLAELKNKTRTYQANLIGAKVGWFNSLITDGPNKKPISKKRLKMICDALNCTPEEIVMDRK